MAFLSSMFAVSVSPLEHPIRTLIFSLPIALFSYWSLQFFREINIGATIITNFKSSPFHFWIKPGKHSLSSVQKKQGFVASFAPPGHAAFLGLLLFASAEFLLVMLFKRMEYTFVL